MQEEMLVDEGTDREPREAVSESGPSMDVGDSELLLKESTGLPKQEEDDDDDDDDGGAVEQERESNANGDEDVQNHVSRSLLDPSSQASCSVMDADSTALPVGGGEPSNICDSDKEKGFESDTEMVQVKDACLENKRTDASEDTNMDMTCDKEITNNSNTDEKMDQDMVTNEDKSRTEDVETANSKLIDSYANDLDEMMDIGTVDQLEQEAQMEEEEQSNVMGADNRSPSAVSNPASVEEDDDVKPDTLLQPTEEDQADDMKVPIDLMPTVSFTSHESAASAGRESSSSLAMLNGMKVVKLSLPTIDSEMMNADQSVNPSVSPPLVKVKDEPVDEEYEQALLSSSSTASVKDEPAKEDLRIGSVYSVTRNSVSPPPGVQTTSTLNPASLHMSCSHCNMNLVKGQTAFQRKGSPALFCSTACLTTSVPTVVKSVKVCHYCQKMIPRPQDTIQAPVDAKGTVKEFCSHNCLSTFNYKRNASTKMPIQALTAQSVCSMCSRYCISKHEVVLNSAVHKICSEACFSRFRAVNKLSMASCGNCGSYCHNSPLMLKLEDCSKNLCNEECLAKFKEKTSISLPCAMCRTSKLISDMVDNKSSDGVVALFCSSSCVMAYKVQTVSASGARVKCDRCGKLTIPAYHLAMSDTSIRNFCTLPCVMAFQETFKNSQKHLSIFTKLPVTSSQIQTATAVTANPVQEESSKGTPKLNCCYCSRKITFKPELIQIEDKMVFLCSLECSLEYKKANNVMSLCEYCKIEKITRDVRRVNNKDCYFCSDGCKLLFKHDLAKTWGKHCRCCAYCLSVSKKLVTAQYGGTTEEFCSDDCRSRYTMLFCHVAKCDTCGRKGKLKQNLAMLGEVKHFCDMNCLLHFCSDNASTQRQVITKEEATPVIANVISLASAQTGKSESDRTAQQSSASNFQAKNFGSVSVQTDATKPPSLPKNLKNKALLCKPLVQNKGVSCKAQTVSAEVQTENNIPSVIVLPVPVPVYVPVPMNMYSQFAPHPVGLPLPLPVPMFLPVTLNNAERIVETIKEIKEKIPSDPFEAELILMAEMVAEEDESNVKEGRPKDMVVEKERERQEGQAPYDHTSNFSDDLDTDELASFLNNWEDPSSDTSLRSPSRPYTQEKPPPILDVPVGMTSEPDSEPPPPPPPPASPPMDIEADFTVEILERMAHLRELAQRAPSPPPAPPRRRQGHRKARDKNKGRKMQRLAKAAEKSSVKGSSKKGVCQGAIKLKSQYGLDAWKRWIQWRQTQPNPEKLRVGSRPIEFKEDILRCTTTELSYGLCRFISEAKRPNGDPYSPDSLFYLCLGIQQYLFENGRVENIFMDRFYNNFSTEFTRMLKDFKPTVTARGYIHSRVEEGFLWDCKQLGAYSPIVLLNTLLFFCCKYFGFTKVEQHRQLSFAHVMRCTKTSANNTKTTFLRFYPPISVNEQEAQETDADGVPAKKRKEESKEEVLEMIENTENPLRCPVRLYEFYLSKCSESVKQRTNLFYLLPERCCVPNSPLWFSSTPLDDSTMEAMLIRILTVRELHLKTGKEQQQTSNDPPFIPDEEEGEGDSD
ncbi:hypothetical protein LDENG_00255810 [Lucifuga dentata]|nr:hypothetical protein LDENG_00255810 [Lucifuga dentata]